MKKLLLILSIFALVGTTSAQENSECVREETGPYLSSKTWQNWFISVGGGANLYMGDNDSKGSFGKRLAPTVNVSIGKWLNPYVGLRGQFSVSKMKGFGAPGTGCDVHLYGDPNSEGYYKQKFNYWNAHAGALFNLSNLLCKYNEKRVWNASLYFGGGFARHFNSHEKEDEKEYTLHTALYNTFRLSKTIALNLEVGWMAVNQRFDLVKSNRKDEFESSLNATLGLTFNLGKTKNFKRPCKAGSDCSVYQKRIDRLDDDLNTLDARNKKLAADLEEANKKLAACQKELAAKPKEVIIEKPTVQEVQTLQATFSNINFATAKSTINQDSHANLDRAAEILKKYPKAHVRLSGYTDNVGNDANNLRLSQQRADAVKSYLQNRGVTATITAVGYGEANPIATNATAEGRAKNRRTEIVVE